MRKKIIILVLLMLVLAAIWAPSYKITYAESLPEKNFVVYDEEDKILFESLSVEIGDIYIDKRFNKYEVYLINKEDRIAKAKFVEKLQKPNVTKRNVGNIGQTDITKKIGLYMSHNDESYLIGDGYDSVYGKGGIHDVAKQLAKDFTDLGISVYLNETLHIPHDSGAYTRSRVTAKSLLSNDLNALFDIHRDGASRSTYAVTYKGTEHCSVRIVVGQANPNKEVNLQLALYLLSVSESVCPWLFLDIFYAKGAYNQDLFAKALLFEMGTYTMEKTEVLETVPYLASVVNTTLFNTTVDEEGDLTIGDTTNNTSNTIDQVVAVNTSENTVKIFTAAIATIGLVFGSAYFVFRYRQKNLQKKAK